jgi:small subunit ribosomal protein S21
MKYNNNNRNFRKPRVDKLEAGGLYVEVVNDDVNRALRRLKKKVNNDGVLQLFREKQYYVKPSEKRRLAKKAGRKRWLKKKAQLDNQ